MLSKYKKAKKKSKLALRDCSKHRLPTFLKGNRFWKYVDLFYRKETTLLPKSAGEGVLMVKN